MEEIIFKNVIGCAETATPISQELFDLLHTISFPIGQRIPSNWEAPTGFTLKKLTLGELPIEHIIPEQKHEGKIILKIHGGGYVWPLMDNYRESTVLLSQLTGYEVVNVDYRLAPTHRYPAALEDCLASYKYLLDLGYTGDDILLIGDSAGGGLCLAITLYLKDHKLPLPKAVVTISPWTELTDDIAPSRRLNFEKDIILGKYGISLKDQGEKQDYRGTTDYRTPYVSPLHGNYDGFPPLLMIAGTYEMLYDDSRRVYDKALAANCDVHFSSYYGMFHCFPELAPELPESKMAWQEIIDFIKKYFVAYH